MSELVDTSALILARREPAARAALQPLMARDEVAVCDVVELEYLMGARNAADYAALEAAFAGFTRVRIEPTDWAQAREVHRALAKIGPGHQRTVRIPDLIIAAVARRVGMPVLHYDEDYDRIAGITGQAARWIVPRGSV